MDGHGEISQQAIASQHCDKSEATTIQCLSHTQWSRYFNFICILTFNLYFQHSLHVIALNFHFPRVPFHQCKDIYVHPYVLLVDSNRPTNCFLLHGQCQLGTFTFQNSLSLSAFHFHWHCLYFTFDSYFPVSHLPVSSPVGIFNFHNRLSLSTFYF